MKQPRNSARWALVVAVALMVSLGAMAETDIYGNEINPIDPKTGETIEYRFWVSGTKAEIATRNGSGESASSSAALATGTYSTPTAAASIEARFRTWLESIGTSINSTLFRGLMLMIR